MKFVIIYLLLFILVISGSAQDRDSLVTIRKNQIDAFKNAGKEFNVPAVLLEAIAFVESRWNNNRSGFSENSYSSFGIMGLRDDSLFGHSLIIAAGLIGEKENYLVNNYTSNIRGAAAYLNFLSKTQTSSGYKFRNLMDWLNVIEKYSGIKNEKIAELYAHDVYYILEKGYHFFGIEIEAQVIDNLLVDKLQKDFETINPGNQGGRIMTAGMPGAVWTPAISGNYGVSNRPTTYAINKIVIHQTEGSFASTIATFQTYNPANAVSAHYVIRSVDGYVVQMVDEKDIAYHAGNLSYNQNSIGIEIEGYADNPSYLTSAALTTAKNICNYDCNTYGIARTRKSIIGHNQVPNPNNTSQWGGANQHYCPGGYFDWDTFIQQVSSTSSSYTPVKINTANLNVRTLPDAAGPLLTTVSQNQEFISYYHDPGGWYLIFIPGSNSKHYDGWVSDTYCTVDNCANQVKVVNAWPTPLNIRSGPSTSYGSLDKVIDNQRFVVKNSSSGWYDFYLPASSSNTDGWSSDSYLNYFTGCGGSQPDLTITAGSQSVSSSTITAGSSITAYASEDNSGTATSGSNDVGLWLSSSSTLNTNNAIYLGAITGFPSLSPNSNSTPRNATVTIPAGTPAGSYYLFFWADGGNCAAGSTCSTCSGVVAETNECNNFASVSSITVTANTGLPDLTITSGTQSVSSSTVAAGSSITAYASEDNSGTATSGSNDVGLWLSSYSTLNTNNAIYLGAITGFPSLSPSSNSTPRNATVTIPSNTAVGTYYIFFWADGGNCASGSSCTSCTGVVNESNECNNFASTVINIVQNCTTQTAPVATSPTNITQTGFQANWNTATGASGYYLDVSSSSDFSSFVNPYSNYPVGNTNSTSVTGLNCNTNYYYRVRAVNNCSASVNSNMIATSTTNCSCTLPSSNFQATTSTTINTGGSVQFQSNATGNPDMFNWLFSGGNPATLLNSTNANPTVTYATAGVYDVSFQAHNSCGWGEWNNATGLVTVNGPCAAPTTQAGNLVFSSVGPNSITVSWTNGNGSKRILAITDFNGLVSPTNGIDPPANTVYAGSGQQVIYNGTGNNVTVTGLTANTTYCFEVFEANCTGTSIVYNGSGNATNPKCQATASCATQAAPTANSASGITSAGFQANWNTVTGATGYYLDVAPSSDFSTFVNGYNNLSVGNTTFAAVTGLTCNTNYYYRVRATNSCASLSGNSNTITSLTTSCSCQAPSVQASNLVFSSVSSTALTISWTNGNGSKRIVKANTSSSFVAPSNGIEFSANNVYNGGEQVVYNGTGSSVTVLGLTPNTNYCFRVYEANCSGTSIVYNVSGIATNPLCQSTSSCATLVAPIINSASNITQTTFQANWNPVSGATGYYLDVSTNASFSNILSGYNNLSVGNVTSYSISGLTCNTNYYYQVREANNCGGISSSSNTVNAITAACCTVPSTPGSISGSNSVCSGTSQLFFVSAVSGASSYTWTLPTGWTGTSTSNSITVVVGSSGGIISVTANNTCGNSAPSSLNVSVTSPVTPSILISPSSTSVCSGQSVLFTATPSNGGNFPTYEWFLNGSSVGTNSATYTTPSLTASAQVYCKLTTSIACATQMTATSSTTTVTVNPVVTPAVTISQAGCSGNSVSFNSSVTNGGSNPAYAWSFSGTGTPGTSTGPNFTLDNTANNTTVQCTLTSNANCANPAQVTSNILTINCIVTSVPTVDGLEEFKIIPNPNSGEFVVKMKLNSIKDVSFKLYNLTGQLLYQSELYHYMGEQTKEFLENRLSAGVYFLETRIGQVSLMNKIVVLK